MPDLPRTMRTLELSAYNGVGALKLVAKPVPEVEPGQVLVKVAAAAVNPPDLMFIRGQYGFTKPLPTVPGFEASGLVVAGNGRYPRWLVGKRVACGVQRQGDGTWAEFALADVRSCLPLLPRVTFEQGATLLVNPFTAWALIERAKRERHRAVVQTAAASALGQMVMRLAARKSIRMIHVVRRDEQVEQLTALGAAVVLNSSEPNFNEVLKYHCHKLGATLAFDAVAGVMPRRLLAAMPRGAKVVVYGALAEQAVTMSPEQFIFRKGQLEGFWLSDYLGSLKLPGLLRRAVQRALATDLRVEVRSKARLEDAVESIQRYQEQMTGGKLLLIPNGS